MSTDVNDTEWAAGYLEVVQGGYGQRPPSQHRQRRTVWYGSDGVVKGIGRSPILNYPRTAFIT
jgi:hypothetical protein